MKKLEALYEIGLMLVLLAGVSLLFLLYNIPSDRPDNG